MPASAGRLEAIHGCKRCLRCHHMLDQRPRRPRGRWKVIQAVFKLGPLGHNRVRFILHGTSGTYRNLVILCSSFVLIRVFGQHALIRGGQAEIGAVSTALFAIGEIGENHADYVG